MSATIDLAQQIILTLPNPDAVQPPGTDGLNTLLGWIKWGGLAFCIAALIVGGAMLAASNRRGEGGEAVQKIALPLIGVVVISAGASLVGFLAS